MPTTGRWERYRSVLHESHGDEGTLTMTTADTFERPAHIAADEWAARVQLAAAYRIFDGMGWAELIYNQLSLRVPGGSGHILMNPFGLHYREVCDAAQLHGSVACHDFEGVTVHADEGARIPTHQARVTAHATAYQHLP